MRGSFWTTRGGVLAVATTRQVLGCAKGAPTTFPRFSAGGGAFLGELYILGIVGFRGLVAHPSSSKLRRGFDFGLHLPGGRPVPIEGVSSSCSSRLPPGLTCRTCSSASGFASGCWGGSDVPSRFFGSVCPYLPHPLPTHPALTDSRFVLRRHAVAPCDSLFRLHGVVVVAGASCFFGVLMRGTSARAD